MPKKKACSRKYWNYRVLAHAGTDEITFSIHQVEYVSCKPHSYDIDPARVQVVEANVLEEGKEPNGMQEMKDTITRMRGALKKPILWAGEKFPQVYSVTLK